MPDCFTACQVKLEETEENNLMISILESRMKQQYHILIIKHNELISLYIVKPKHILKCYIYRFVFLSCNEKPYIK